MNDLVTTDEDMAVAIPATTLVANDTDADGDSLVVASVGAATHGSVALANGNVTFTPEQDFFGTATFEYTVSDGTRTAAATVTVTVNPVNDAPDAVADTASMDEDDVLVLPAAVLVANDTDVEGDSLEVVEVGMATQGAVTLASGNVTFTPEPNFFGTATFEYTVSDGTRTSTSTVSVTVNPVNDAPVAVADSADADEDVELRIPIATLLSNDSDVDADALTVSQVANALNGTVELDGDTVSFRPAPGFVGAASFDYQVSDSQGATATGSVSVRVSEHVLKALSADGMHTCAVYVDGRVRCWGENGVGSLGLGHNEDVGGEPGQMGSFLPFAGLGTGQKATTVAGSCAILEGGAVKCWGYNDTGELGLGDREFRGDEPGEIGDALPFVDLGTGRTATALASGRHHTCAVLENGAVKCWGYYGSGMLGLGDTESRGDGPGEMGNALPEVALGTGRTAKAVAAGSSHTCAILDNDTVKCWGSTYSGQVGIGNQQWGYGDDPGEMGDALPSVNLGTGRTVKTIATHGAHTCALLDNDSVKCWGLNDQGQLGLGDTENRGTSLAQMGDALPSVNLGAGRTARAIAVGRDHSCAILDDGSVKCWGANDHGKLGLGDRVARGDGPGEMGDALPAVNLGTGRTAKSLTAGTSFNCAILDNDTVKCWGMNQRGTLGLGDYDNRGDDPGEMGDALPVVEL